VSCILWYLQSWSLISCICDIVGPAAGWAAKTSFPAKMDVRPGRRMLISRQPMPINFRRFGRRLVVERLQSQQAAGSSRFALVVYRCLRLAGLSYIPNLLTLWYKGHIMVSSSQRRHLQMVKVRGHIDPSCTRITFRLRNKRCDLIVVTVLPKQVYCGNLAQYIERGYISVIGSIDAEIHM
jgi:hypothetical protein